MRRRVEFRSVCLPDILLAPVFKWHYRSIGAEYDLERQRKTTKNNALSHTTKQFYEVSWLFDLAKWRLWLHTLMEINEQFLLFLLNE